MGVSAVNGDGRVDAAKAARAGEILESRGADFATVEEADGAIDALEAVLTAEEAGLLRATILSNLGVVWMQRFHLTSSPQDLDRAIEHLAEAQSHLRHASHPALTATIPNLISALQTRAELTGSTTDLDEAIRWGREAAVRLRPGLPQRAVALASLSSALRMRFELSPAEARYEGDLTEAIELGRRAVDDLPRNHPRLSTVLSGLGRTLMASGRAGEAVDVYRRALETARAGGPRGEGRALNDLAGALAGAGRAAEAVAVYEEALERFRSAGDTGGEERVLGNLSAVRAMTAPGTPQEG